MTHLSGVLFHNYVDIQYFKLVLENMTENVYPGPAVCVTVCQYFLLSAYLGLHMVWDLAFLTTRSR